MTEGEYVAAMMSHVLESINHYTGSLEGRELLIWKAALGCGMVKASGVMTNYLLDKGIDETTPIGSAMADVMEEIADLIETHPSPSEILA